MITLDGRQYNVYQNQYGKNADRPRSTDRGLTGLPIRVESGYFVESYDLTLLCTATDIAFLRASFKKVDYTSDPPTNLLDFVDAQGWEWNPAGTGTGCLGTGVYFDSPISPKPLTPRGWGDSNRFTVAIKLVVNDDGSHFN